MTVANWIFSHPSLYWSLALLVSAYYGFRGFVYQTVDMRESWKKAPNWKKVVVWYIQDTIYNFVCSMAGFIALFALYRAQASINNWHDIQIGTATYFAFLSLIALLGITGVLPRTFGRGGLTGKQ
jgi:magnesium-transporting ATPase (P-type)